MGQTGLKLAAPSIVAALGSSWGLARLLAVEEAAVMAMVAGGMLFLVVLVYAFDQVGR